MKRALFLDRDGVINVDIGHAHRADQIQFLPGVFDLVRAAKEKGMIVVVVTNQAGIAKGYYSVDQFWALSGWMNEQFKKHGGEIDAFNFCPHHPEGVVPELSIACTCRKPQPGLFLKALAAFEIDARRSVMVGDKLSDAVAASSAGIGKIYLLQDAADETPEGEAGKFTVIGSLRQVELGV